MSQHNLSKLIIFTRLPLYGKVKTRLQPEYSKQQSLELHKHLIQHTLAEFGQLTDVDVELYVSPGDEHEYIENVANEFRIKTSSQQGSDLGEKMANALQYALSSYDKAIIIGTDCPQLSIDIIDDVLVALDKNDVVLSPAYDGGYVLLGLTKFYKNIFQNIEWGSDQVYASTCSILEEDNISWKKCGMFRDIDRPEDLECFPEFKNLITR